ncbi:MAG: hypothetical protein KI793_28780 [Rivularia sp. (in: Bacteria)]|nr:hypothetical protein [Rivularia sp. MS3]
MNKRFFLNFTLSLFVLAPISLPVLAKETNIQTITEQPSPRNTFIEAIIVTFPSDVEFDAGGKKQLPVVLRTVEPVYNNVGKVVIPANSRVEAVLVPAEKGTMIIASSLIMNGKSYPFRAASSNKIPANKITKKSRMEQAMTYSASVSRFSPVYNNLTGSTQSRSLTRNNLLIQGVGAIVGFLSPRSMLASRIPKGSEHILHLQQPLSLDTTQNIPVMASSGDDK